REAGATVTCVDLTRVKLTDEQILGVTAVGFFLPMHTATRLALPVIDRVRTINPGARLIAYGLYAPLNEGLLREQGVTDVLGGECEGAVVGPVLPGPRQGSVGPPERFARRQKGGVTAADIPRLQFRVPERAGLPPLTRYATLQIKGERRTVGY